MKAKWDKEKWRRLRRGAKPLPGDKFWCEMTDDYEWLKLSGHNLLLQVQPGEVIIRRLPQGKRKGS